MNNTKNTSITLAAAAALGLSLFASNADAQGWRGGYGGNQNGYNNNSGHGQSSSGYNRGYRGQRDTLKQDVQTVDRLANQITRQFAMDLRRNPRCRESIKLMMHLRTYTGKTNNLVLASNGTCKVTFKKAARDVRDTLTCVQKQAKRVPNLGCSIKGMIDQSCPIATRIIKNSDRFNPAGSFTNGPRGNHGPAVAGRGGYRNQDPRSIFTSLLRGFNW